MFRNENPELSDIIYASYKDIFDEFGLTADSLINDNNPDYPLIYKLITDSVAILDSGLFNRLKDTDDTFNSFCQINGITQERFTQFYQENNPLKNIKSVRDICKSEYRSRYSEICANLKNNEMSLLKKIMGSKLTMARNRMLTDIYYNEKPEYRQILVDNEKIKKFFYNSNLCQHARCGRRMVGTQYRIDGTYDKNEELREGNKVYIKNDDGSYSAKVIYKKVPTSLPEWLRGQGKWKYNLQNKGEKYFARLDVNPKAKNRVYFSTLSSESDKTGKFLASIGDVNDKILDSIITDLNKSSRFKEYSIEKKREIFIELYKKANELGSNFGSYKNAVHQSYGELSEIEDIDTILTKILCISSHRETYILKNRNNTKIVSWFYDIKKLLWQSSKNDSQFKALINDKIASNDNDICDVNNVLMKNDGSNTVPIDFLNQNCMTTFYEANFIGESIYGFVYRDSRIDLNNPKQAQELLTKYMPLEPLNYEPYKLLDISDEKRKTIQDYFKEKGMFLYRKPITWTFNAKQYKKFKDEMGDSFEYVSGPDDNNSYTFYINDNYGNSLKLIKLNQDYNPINVSEQESYGFKKLTPETVITNFIQETYSDSDKPEDYPESGRLVKNQLDKKDIYPRKLPDTIDYIKSENGKNKYIPIIFVTCGSSSSKASLREELQEERGVASPPAPSEEVDQKTEGLRAWVKESNAKEKMTKILEQHDRNETERAASDSNYVARPFNFIDFKVNELDNGNIKIEKNEDASVDMQRPLFDEVEYVSTESLLEGTVYERDTDEYNKAKKTRSLGYFHNVSYIDHPEYFEFDSIEDIEKWWDKNRSYWLSTAVWKLAYTLFDKVGLDEWKKWAIPDSTTLYDENGKLAMGTQKLEIIQQLLRLHGGPERVQNNGKTVYRLFKHKKKKKYKVQNVDNKDVLGLRSYSGNDTNSSQILYMDIDLFQRNINGELITTGEDKTEGSLLERALKYKYKLSPDGDRIFICSDAMQQLSTNDLKVLFSSQLPSTGMGGRASINVSLIEE